MYAHVYASSAAPAALGRPCSRLRLLNAEPPRSCHIHPTPLLQLANHGTPCTACLVWRYCFAWSVTRPERNSVVQATEVAGQPYGEVHA